MAEAKKRKKRASKRTSSLSKISLSKMFKDIKTPTMLIIGFLAGKQIGLMIDKATNQVEGIVGIDGKQLLKPLGTIGVGMAVSQLAKTQEFKMIGYGIAVQGGFVMLKDVAGYDLLSGIGAETTIGNAELPPASPELNLPELESAMDELERQVEGLSSTELDDEPSDEIEHETIDDDDFDNDEIIID